MKKKEILIIFFIGIVILLLLSLLPSIRNNLIKYCEIDNDCEAKIYYTTDCGSALYTCFNRNEEPMLNLAPFIDSTCYERYIPECKCENKKCVEK